MELFLFDKYDNFRILRNMYCNKIKKLDFPKYYFFSIYTTIIKLRVKKTLEII